jgi:hypothetical protein
VSIWRLAQRLEPYVAVFDPDLELFAFLQLGLFK